MYINLHGFLISSSINNQIRFNDQITSIWVLDFYLSLNIDVFYYFRQNLRGCGWHAFELCLWMWWSQLLNNAKESWFGIMSWLYCAAYIESSKIRQWIFSFKNYYTKYFSRKWTRHSYWIRKKFSNKKRVANFRCPIHYYHVILVYVFCSNNILSTQLMHVRQKRLFKMFHLYFHLFSKIFKCHYITKRQID